MQYHWVLYYKNIPLNRLDLYASCYTLFPAKLTLTIGRENWLRSWLSLTSKISWRSIRYLWLMTKMENWQRQLFVLKNICISNSAAHWCRAVLSRPLRFEAVCRSFYGAQQPRESTNLNFDLQWIDTRCVKRNANVVFCKTITHNICCYHSVSSYHPGSWNCQRRSLAFWDILLVIFTRQPDFAGDKIFAFHVLLVIPWMDLGIFGALQHFCLLSTLKLKIFHLLYRHHPVSG